MNRTEWEAEEETLKEQDEEAVREEKVDVGIYAVV